MVDYATFVNSISFRMLTRDRPVPRLLHTLAARVPAVYRMFEIWNTNLGANGVGLRQRLGPLCRLPRMSTFAIGAMINEGVGRMPSGEAFVNVGVWNGFTFLSALAGNSDKRCIGIDNFSEFGGPREDFLRRFEQYRSPQHHFFDMDYRRYFAEVHRGPIGFYLYDGDHSYENQLLGLEVAEPHLAPGALLLVDDTNTAEPKQATLDFMARSRSRYEVLLDQTTHANCHPTLWNGVMLLRKAR